MRILLILFCGVLVTGCGVSKSSFSPAKKYSPENYRKIILFTSRYWKKHIPVYIGTNPKTVWIIISTGERNNSKIH